MTVAFDRLDGVPRSPALAPLSATLIGRPGHGRHHHRGRHGGGRTEPARRLAAAHPPPAGTGNGVAAAWTGLCFIRRPSRTEPGRPEHQTVTAA
jgi:hypothetical protein